MNESWRKNFLSIEQLQPVDVDEIFNRAAWRKGSYPADIIYNTDAICTLFYEPSTRTSSSFQAAAFDLGYGVIPINNVEYSSVAKGENLADTVRTLSEYCKLIVLRHPEEWAAELAADYATVPIINAGCGNGEHPTQALLDYYTIREKMGMLAHLKYNVTIFGDCKNSRTVHSLVKMLAMMQPGVHINYVAPQELQIPTELALYTDCHMISPEDVDKVLPETDVLYVVRMQKERGSKGEYKLNMKQLKKLPTDSIVMHPFPRNKELPADFDNDPRAKYFNQIANGRSIRRALLSLMC